MSNETVKQKSRKALALLRRKRKQTNAGRRSRRARITKKRSRNWFARQRKAIKKSQRDIAVELHVANTTVYWWEQDRSVPSEIPAADLAKVYGVEPDVIVREISTQKDRIIKRRRAKK